MSNGVKHDGSVPEASSGSRWFLLLIAAPIVLVVVAAAGASWYFLSGPRVNRADLILHRVVPGSLLMTIVERGTLESARNEDVYCRVKTGGGGGSSLPQIKWVIPDGSHVKKGDLLLEIEDARFQDQLKLQEIAVLQAESAWRQAEEAYNIVESQNNSDMKTAELTIELATLDEKKYIEGEYPQQLLDIKGRTRIAEFDLGMSLDRYFWAERMVMKQYYTRTQAKAELSKVESSGLALTKVQEEMRVLENYTKEKMLRELRSKVEEAERSLVRVKTQAKAKHVQADTDRKTKESVYKQEQKRYQEILHEIEKCRIHSPQDGLVIYYVPESSSRSSSGSPRSAIAQGEPVAEGQRLMRIPDLRHMVVNTRVHEALVSRAKVGQEAIIRIDAFPDRVLRARVKQVANVAAKPDWMSADVKVYPTIVEILEEVDGLRPDMSAEVTTFTDAPLQSVLTAPVQAIFGSVQMGKSRRCFVMTPRGPEEREVVIGMSNDTHVQIKSGLQEGDDIVVNPRVLLGDKEKTRPANPEGRPGAGDDRSAPSFENRPAPSPATGENPGQPKTGAGEKTGRPKGAGGGPKKGPPSEPAGK